MKESFDRNTLDPDEVLGLRDNKEEVNIIPGEVIGGLRGGKVEYFESVEAQIEELRAEREKNLLNTVEKALDMAPGTGLLYPLYKAILGRDMVKGEIDSTERLALLSQVVALSIAYTLAGVELSGHGGTGVIAGAAAGKVGAMFVQLKVSKIDVKEYVITKLREYNNSHPGYSILFGHIADAVDSLPEKYFRAREDSGYEDLDLAIS